MSCIFIFSQEVINVRRNTETALFDDAVTLISVNGSFLWSNGSILMGEEYSADEQKYYQHIYPVTNYSYHLILSNFTDQQPVPFPKNPPQSLQAVTTSNKLKANWQIPHLLGGQGKQLIFLYNLDILQNNPLKKNIIKSKE